MNIRQNWALILSLFIHGAVANLYFLAGGYFLAKNEFETLKMSVDRRLTKDDPGRTPKAGKIFYHQQLVSGNQRPQLRE
jgi:predicted DNA repair protein MutK